MEGCRAFGVPFPVSQFLSDIYYGIQGQGDPTTCRESLWACESTQPCVMTTDRVLGESTRGAGIAHHRSPGFPT